MPETKKRDEEQTDSRGDVFDMSAHIPQGTSTAHEVERNMDAKLNEIGDGIHTTSATFGKVVSDEATDAVGQTPEDIAAQAEGRGVKSGRASGEDKQASDGVPDPSEVVGQRKGLEQDDKDEDDKPTGKSSKAKK